MVGKKPDSVVALLRNRWSVISGFDGRLFPESLVVYFRIGWSETTGICTWSTKPRRITTKTGIFEGGIKMFGIGLIVVTGIPSLLLRGGKVFSPRLWPNR